MFSPRSFLPVVQLAALALLCCFAEARAETLLLPRLGTDWRDLSTNEDLARECAEAEAIPVPEGSDETTRSTFLLQRSGVWHCYFSATEKGQAGIYLRTSPDLTGWSEPKLVAKGGKAGLGDTSAENPQVVEAQPGHFYLFRTHRDGDSIGTSVYHSTDPTIFGIEGRFGDAMHFVGTMPVAARHVLKSNDGWVLVTEDKKFAPLRWEPLATPTRATTRPPGISLRVALFDDAGSFGKGVPKVSEQLATAKDIEVTVLDADGIRAGLSGYDLVIFTGGSGGKQANTIGLLGREQVRRFVEAGGGYVGICAGAYLACDGFSWGLKVLDAKTPSPKWERGRGNLKWEANETAQKLLGLPHESSVVYHNGPVLVPARNAKIPDFEPLVFFRSEVSKVPEQKGLQIDTPAIVRGTFGKGRVLVSSPHPEQTEGFENWIVSAVRAVSTP